MLTAAAVARAITKAFIPGPQQHSQPLDVALLETTSLDSLKVGEPGKVLASLLSPPLVRVGADRLVVDLLVRVKVGADEWLWTATLTLETSGWGVVVLVTSVLVENLYVVNWLSHCEQDVLFLMGERVEERKRKVWMEKEETGKGSDAWGGIDIRSGGTRIGFQVWVMGNGYRKEEVERVCGRIVQ